MFTRGAISLFLHRLIYTMCLKCPPLANMHGLSSECHWSTDVSNCALFNACQIWLGTFETPYRRSSSRHFFL